jgi:hypothetical protein
MLDLEARVRPNTQDVAAKVLDGEAIMINLTLGTYYSLDRVGTVVWELIERGHSLKRIVEALTSRFDVSPETAEADLQRLVGEMLEEGIVLRVDEGVKRDREPPPSGTTKAKSAYEPPELSIYRDMADLLALEPPTPGSAQEELW